MHLGYVEEGICSCDGPVILIAGEQDELDRLADALRDLELPGARPLDVHAFPGVVAHRGLHLTAYPVDEERGVRRASQDALAFTWRHSHEGWLEAAEKLANMSSFGYQNLGSWASEDATIVAAGTALHPESWWREHDGPRKGSR